MLRQSKNRIESSSGFSVEDIDFYHTRYSEGPRTLTIFREPLFAPKPKFLLYLADARFWEVGNSKTPVSADDAARVARNLVEAYKFVGVDVDIDMPNSGQATPHGEENPNGRR